MRDANITGIATACRYKHMLVRAKYAPEKHMEHLEHVQNKQGADAIKLGAVSNQLYKNIFNGRAFDEFYFQIPPKKRCDRWNIRRRKVY